LPCQIVRRASASPPDVEALYLRGDLQASGALPSHFRKNLKAAFSDFELSARMGFAASWFRIGRDYEVLGDTARAIDAYERGVNARDVGSVYRLGMANLLGQLGMRADHGRAVALLRQAADAADLDTPQPAYIYGMLLAGACRETLCAVLVLTASLPQASSRTSRCRAIS
jgi:TPR repeat protein